MNWILAEMRGLVKQLTGTAVFAVPVLALFDNKPQKAGSIELNFVDG